MTEIKLFFSSSSTASLVSHSLPELTVIAVISHGEYYWQIRKVKPTFHSSSGAKPNITGFTTLTRREWMKRETKKVCFLIQCQAVVGTGHLYLPPSHLLKQRNMWQRWWATSSTSAGLLGGERNIYTIFRVIRRILSSCIETPQLPIPSLARTGA